MISIILIVIIIFIIINNRLTTTQRFIIYISSCNRFYYLNITINSIINHMTIYESILYHIILFDQGTIEVYNNYFIKNKHIFNIFYMNPNGYIYTYNIIFSYLYSKYVLLIDDDRPIRVNIEKYLQYSNFLSVSMNIMDSIKDIYGVILKREGDGNVTCFKKKFKSKTIRYCKVEKAFVGYYFSNGASIYRTSELKRVKEYLAENIVARFFSNTKYRMAYLLLNDTCNSVSNKCNFIIDHIGKNSSLRNKNICTVFLY